MVNKREQKANRIPVHFVDDEKVSADDAGNKSEHSAHARSDQDDLSSEEIGRESSYEGETEMKRRIDRGQEKDGQSGRERADESDSAGGPPRDELPERREDQDRAAPDSPPSTRNSAPAGNKDGAAQATANAEVTGPVLAELIATRAELRRVEGERGELREALARRQADFENYRKRVERDRSDSYHRLVGDVVSKLLPVFDNLRRALDAEETLQANESEEFRHFLSGVDLISRQLSEVLIGLGVQPIESIGKRFDPHLHEAVATEMNPDVEPDTVVQELAQGFLIGERLLRPAVVKVSTR
jgi:molecular chaperone GrpE